MARKRRQQRSTPQTSQPTSIDSCAYSTSELYRSRGTAAPQLERITVEVSFPADTLEVDCRDFGFHGELGAAIVRAIDPHWPGRTAVEKATTYRARESNRLVLVTRVAAPKGTLRDLALRLDKQDMALELTPFSPLPGSNLLPARGRARVLGAEKYIAAQYHISGVPTDISNHVAWEALEKAYKLDPCTIRRAVLVNHTSELLVTTRPGAPRLPEEHTYSYRDEQQRMATATLRAFPCRAAILEPTVSCTPPPRAHAQAARRDARQRAAATERQIVHNDLLWQAYWQAEGDRQTAAAAQAAAQQQTPTDPRPAAAAAAAAAATATAAAGAPAPNAAARGGDARQASTAGPAAAARPPPPAAAPVVSLDQRTQTLHELNAQESEAERKRLRQAAREKQRQDAAAAANRRQAAEAEEAAAAANTAPAATTIASDSARAATNIAQPAPTAPPTAPAPAAEGAAPQPPSPGPGRPERGRTRERSPQAESPQEAPPRKRSQSRQEDWLTASDLDAMYTTGGYARKPNETDENFERRVNGSRAGLARGRSASAETRARQAAERRAGDSQSKTPRKPRRNGSASGRGTPRANQDIKTPSRQLRPSQDNGDDDLTNTTPSQVTAAISPLTQHP